MTNEPRGICLPPGTEILGRHETPVYADDGRTVLYTAVTLRLRVPPQARPAVVLSLIDDPHNRQRRLRADAPGRPRLIGPWVFDNCPDQLQMMINLTLMGLGRAGVVLSDDDPPVLELTRAQADRIAATREYRLTCLGAPDALRYDPREVARNERARAGLPPGLDTGDTLYGLAVRVAADPPPDGPNDDSDSDADPPIIRAGGRTVKRAVLDILGTAALACAFVAFMVGTVLLVKWAVWGKQAAADWVTG